MMQYYINSPVCEFGDSCDKSWTSVAAVMIRWIPALLTYLLHVCVTMRLIYRVAHQLSNLMSTYSETLTKQIRLTLV